MTGGNADIPGWLSRAQDYDPPVDRDRYMRRTSLALMGALSQLRFDDGKAGRLSASAPVKLALALGCILLASLARNFAFVVVMLALVLARMAMLPAQALKRAVSVSAAAAAFTFALMIPAAIIGQPQSALFISAKVLVSVGIVLVVALTTPHHELTGALRAFHVPALVVMTIDLALRNIVRLGQVALEVLTALRLRSVGRNARKGDAIGGVGGTVLLKSADAATDAFDAMTCRGFDGDFRLPRKRWICPVDAAWVVGFACLVAAFIWLEGVL